jgi:hypothetical protein
MLQNFADLEDATAPKAQLWLLIGKDHSERPLA